MPLESRFCLAESGCPVAADHTEGLVARVDLSLTDEPPMAQAFVVISAGAGIERREENSHRLPSTWESGIHRRAVPIWASRNGSCPRT